jgi:RNase P/RNase MRP subunit p29
MAKAGNTVQNRPGGKGTSTTNKTSNDHGSVCFGHIHKPGDCIADVLIQGSCLDKIPHEIVLDKDGPRRGCTQIMAPNRIVIQGGSISKEAEDSLVISSKNGNIVIKAENGKIRLHGTDIEMVAVGEGGSKGNITMTAGENITMDGKKVLVNAKTFLKLASPGNVEMAANSGMKIYASMIREITDAVAVKDSKVGGKDFQSKESCPF